MDNEKIITQESVHAVSEKGELKAIVRRDPASGKHLVYLVQEATSDDIADMIGRRALTNEKVADVIIDDDEEKKG